MKKLVLTAAIILGFVMGSFAQEDQPTGGGLFGYGRHPGQQMRDDEAGLFLPGDGTHGIGGNADGTDTYFDDTEWNWQSHISPLGSGALLLMGFGAAYAMSKRKKKD